MNKPIDDFKDYIVDDALGHVDGITAKKMFGGYGLYQDGAIFAIITSDVDVYFKVDETNQKRYEELGSEQFVYTGHKNKKPTPMPYWIVREETLEDRELIADMVHESADISRKNKK